MTQRCDRMGPNWPRDPRRGRGRGHGRTFVERDPRLATLLAVLAASLRSWLDEPHNQALVARLRAAGLRMEVPPEARVARVDEGPLKGKTYVLTGTLASMTREQATAAIEAATPSSPAPPGFPVVSGMMTMSSSGGVFHCRV